MSVFKKVAVGAVALCAGVAMAACSPPHENDSSNRGFGEVTQGPTQPSLVEVTKPTSEPSSASTSSVDPSAQETTEPSATEPARSSEANNPPTENAQAPAQGTAADGAAQAPAQ